LLPSNELPGKSQKGEPKKEPLNGGGARLSIHHPQILIKGGGEVQAGRGYLATRRTAQNRRGMMPLSYTSEETSTRNLGRREKKKANRFIRQQRTKGQKGRGKEGRPSVLSGA